MTSFRCMTTANFCSFFWPIMGGGQQIMAGSSGQTSNHICQVREHTHTHIKVGHLSVRELVRELRSPISRPVVLGTELAFARRGGTLERQRNIIQQ